MSQKQTRGLGHLFWGNTLQQADEQVSQRPFTHPSQQDAGDGDAKLRRGDGTIQVQGGRGHSGGTRNSLRDHGFDLGPAHSHQGEFGRHKKGIQQDEEW